MKSWTCAQCTDVVGSVFLCVYRHLLQYRIVLVVPHARFSWSPREHCSCNTHGARLSYPRPICFLAPHADPQEPKGGQCRGLLACARQSATAGAPSSSTVGIWLLGRSKGSGTRLLHRGYVDAAKARLARFILGQWRQAPRQYHTQYTCAIQCVADAVSLFFLLILATEVFPADWSLLLPSFFHLSHVLLPSISSSVVYGSY